MDTKECLACGVSLFKTSKIGAQRWENKKFCSIACRTDHWRVCPPPQAVTQRTFRVCLREDCDNELIVPAHLLGRKRYCSRECYAAAQRAGSEVTCAAEGCSNVRYYRPRDLLRGAKYCSQECASEVHRGENNSRWKGGITPLRKQVRECPEYHQWRSACLARDDYTCASCTKRGGTKHVHHHPVSFRQLLENGAVTTLEEAVAYAPLWDTDNGQVLCKGCHLEEHRAYELTRAVRLEIGAQYTGAWGQQAALAREYGVSKKVIDNVLKMCEKRGMTINRPGLRGKRSSG